MMRSTREAREIGAAAFCVERRPKIADRRKPCGHVSDAKIVGARAVCQFVPSDRCRNRRTRHWAR